MRRAASIILVIALCAGVVLVDPSRGHGAARIPEAWSEAADLPPRIGRWTAAEADGTLPWAISPRRAVRVLEAAYAPARGRPATARVRIVLAADRRDLLAVCPDLAMSAGGWERHELRLETASTTSTHQRRAGPVAERAVAYTAFAIPGRVAGSWEALGDLDAAGPGWPGPGAAVQAVVRGEPAAGRGAELAAWVEQAAARLAGAGQGGP